MDIPTHVDIFMLMDILLIWTSIYPYGQFNQPCDHLPTVPEEPKNPM